MTDGDLAKGIQNLETLLKRLDKTAQNIQAAKATPPLPMSATKSAEQQGQNSPARPAGPISEATTSSQLDIPKSAVQHVKSAAPESQPDTPVNRAALFVKNMKKILIVFVFLMLAAGGYLAFKFNGDSILFCVRSLFSSKNIFLFELGGKWGYINAKGAVIVPPQYDDAYMCSDGACAVKSSSKWGYLDTKGKTLIAPQFDDAGDFNGGIAQVRLADKYGYINKQGKYIAPPQFKYDFDRMDLVAQMLWLKLDHSVDKYHFFARIFSQEGPYKEGLAKVAFGDKFGYINNTGKVVINPQFDAAGNFSDGRALIVFERKAGYIDNVGKTVISPQFDAAGEFAEGFAQVVIGDKVGYIDKTGRISISPQFEDAGSFTKDGLAKVKLGGVWGFINKQGFFVVNPQYQDVFDFSEGFAAVEVDGKWGFINTKGVSVVLPLYNSVHGNGFEQGVCRVMVDGVNIYINTKGQYIFNPLGKAEH